MEWSYSEDRKRIKINPPKQRLRISGHRFPAVMGLDKWSSPFQAWCEITKLVKKPFEETKYIIAGRVLEPKIIDYIRPKYPNVMSIEEYYGNNFETYRYNNFQDESNIFGGVIDAVSTRNDKRTIAMICECKTSSKAYEWANGQIPVSYLMQGALYSYLKGLDSVLFVCTFLKDDDYAHPELVEVTDENTIMRVVQLSDIVIPINGKYMNIQDCVDYCTDWWNTYIEGGISPEFDEKVDKEYLDMIRASKPCEDNDVVDVANAAIALAKAIDELKVTSGLNAMEKELKTLEASLKDKMIEDNIEVAGKYKLKTTTKEKFNEKKFAEKEPNRYKKYIEEVTTYTLSKDKKEEENNG